MNINQSINHDHAYAANRFSLQRLDHDLDLGGALLDGQTKIAKCLLIIVAILR